MHKERIGQTEFSFELVESKQELEELYRLRYQVYCNECNFLKEEDYPESKESDKYDPYSLHFVARDSHGPIGTARLIMDNPNGFPIETHYRGSLDFDIKSANHKQVAEISRLTISKSYRRRKDDELYYSKDYVDPGAKPETDGLKRIKPMAFGIYREIYQECKRRNIAVWVAMMEKTLWLLLRMHNFAFRPVGEEIDVYGPVRPYVCEIGDVEKNVYQKSSDNLYKYFLEGLEPEYHPKLPEKQLT